MKKISIIGLILFFALSSWAQQTNKPVKMQPSNQNQIQLGEQTTSHSTIHKNRYAVQQNNQERVTNYQQQSIKSAQRVPVKIVKNTRSGDQKVRAKFGPATDSGPKLIMEKQKAKFKSAPAGPKKTLSDRKKVKATRIAVDLE